MTKHDPSHAHRHRRERRTARQKKPMACARCNGLGAVQDRFPSNKDFPCYWFSAGARTCPDCDGTGEIDDWQDDQQEGQDDEQ